MCLPELGNVGNIENYIYNHPINGMTTIELELEYNHWCVALRERAWEEHMLSIRVRNVPDYSKLIYRWGGLLLAIFGVPAGFGDPWVGFCISIGGVCMGMWGAVSDQADDVNRNNAMKASAIAFDRWQAIGKEILIRVR
jgi:hypothetical protein